MKLKHKLFIAAFLLLLLPVTIVQFLRSLDHWLVEKDRAYLKIRTQNIASAIAPFASTWFPETSIEGQPVFPMQLKTAPILDGFDSEWDALPPNWISIKGSDIRYLVAYHQSYYYLFIQQTTQSDKAGLLNFQLTFFTKPDEMGKGQKIAYLIHPEGPGKVFSRDHLNHLFPRIQGNWQNLENQSALELRIPADLFLSQLQIKVTESSKQFVSDKMQLLQPAISQQQFLNQVQLLSGEKIWLLGGQGEVMGTSGELVQDLTFPTSFLLTWLVGSVPENAKDPWSGYSQINIDNRFNFDKQSVHTAIEPGLNANQKRIIAVAKLTGENNHNGFILIEKISGSSLLLSQPQVGNLINILMIVLIITIISLFYFVSKITINISYLKKQFSDALTKEGKVKELLPASRKKDEIGMLSRSIYKNLKKQQGFQEYKERLASRLSHELRTPLAIVRGALDNLQVLKNNNHPVIDEQQQYIDRAIQGIDRMSAMIRRMREAAALEQSINQQPKTMNDLVLLIRESISGFDAIWPEYEFQFHSKIQQMEIEFNPELIVQAMEKMLSNAVDFCTPGAPILISLRQEAIQGNQFAIITIVNKGPLLPEGEHHFFDNLTSIREKDEKGQIHLGLGLHIAYLIANYHQGFMKINNLDSHDGVEVELTIRM